MEGQSAINAGFKVYASELSQTSIPFLDFLVVSLGISTLKCLGTLEAQHHHGQCHLLQAHVSQCHGGGEAGGGRGGTGAVETEP